MVFITTSPRVLSVQSHVVSGYCGNKSATFPLQLLEFEVDVLNTVQLSNHTQYNVAPGQIFTSEDLEKIHEGLKENKIHALYSHILSGYIADADYLGTLANLIMCIKEDRRKLGLACSYTLDPVLGDDGTGYYVPNGPLIAEAYKKHLIPLADIITPNRFEASVLSGVEIDVSSPSVMEQTVEVIKKFHELGVQLVVITSFYMADNRDELICVVSYKKKICYDQPSGDLCPSPQSWEIRVPKLDCPFTGTGDLFAALLTGWLSKTNSDLKKSFENTVNTIYEILANTQTWCKQVNDRSVQNYELRLVQNKAQIITPNDRFKAKKFIID